MPYQSLKFTPHGDLYIFRKDDVEVIINTILGNDELFVGLELGIGSNFSPDFLINLMFAGYYITSGKLRADTMWFDQTEALENIKYKYFPIANVWKIQTVLFFGDLHEPKSARRLIPRYELRINYNFKQILERCIEVHGDGWITNPLKKSLMSIHGRKNAKARVVSFELYRDNELMAGEFGVITGKIYTSYSGFYNEPSAGTVQLIMMLRYLRETGFAFCNFGTDDSRRNNAYKRRLGACYIDRKDFFSIWRTCRDM
jgi:leucyl/phenylalanyl-tRNA--protein transferase